MEKNGRKRTELSTNPLGVMMHACAPAPERLRKEDTVSKKEQRINRSHWLLCCEDKKSCEDDRGTRDARAQGQEAGARAARGCEKPHGTRRHSGWLWMTQEVPLAREPCASLCTAECPSEESVPDAGISFPSLSCS